LFFINRYETNNREKLSRTIRIMEREVKNTIVVDWNKMDSTHTTIQIADKQLELAVQKISDIHGLDINLYDLEGNLRISSLPLPYKKGILSTKMDPVAYYHMNIKKEIQYFYKYLINCFSKYNYDLENVEKECKDHREQNGDRA
jgi:hypothetical protein